MPQKESPPYSAWAVMGVSGCGKSTVARAAAEDMGIVFADADDFHPPGNLAKMRSGIPLTDDDRWPWLDALREWLGEHKPCVLTCSALRQVYRERLSGSSNSVRFVHLAADFDALLARMESREHFMPPSLLRSQLETLEPPAADEALILDATLPVDQLVTAIVSDARR